MKWLAFAGLFVCLARFGESGALKCIPGAQDGACRTKQTYEKEVTLQKETEAECLPGSEWESNCHYCRCSDTGVAECLKQDICGDGIIDEPIRCKPNTTFERDCNTCICLENGLGLCTMNFCRRSSIDKECAPGTTWSSQCNTCRCTSSGQATCTEIACPIKSGPVRQCAPESEWQNECFSCWCTDGGLPMCMRTGCVGAADLQFDDNSKKGLVQKVPEVNVSVSRTRRASSQVVVPSKEPPKTCLPGQEFRMDCNKCLCDNEGQDFSCTRIDCNALNNNNGGSRRKRDVSKQVTTECAPSSLFDHGCNTCRCTLDGHHAVCTLQRCSTQQINQNGVDPSNTDLESSFRCNPGEQFKRACNDCTCSADGKSVFCTLRLCDKDIAVSV